MDYIGQEKLIESLSKTNARAMLIQGPAHSGKKTLIRQLYKDLGLYVYEVSGSVSAKVDSITVFKFLSQDFCDTLTT